MLITIEGKMFELKVICNGVGATTHGLLVVVVNKTKNSGLVAHTLH